MRSNWQVAFLALIVVGAGCAAPSHTGPPAGTGERPDPPTDRIGWEDGLWYDDPIDVEAGDGLNERELELVITRAMARIERIRRLEFEKTVPVELITRETYREERLGSGPTNATRRTFENVKKEALFLVGESTDSVETERDNRASSVLGFYSPGKEQIVIVSDSASPQLEVRTLAHELVHALQDQQFGFVDGRGDGTDESARARGAVVEGDARYVDRIYTQRCQAQWSCIEPPASDGDANDGNSSSDSGNLHLGLYIASIFVYADGSTFVKQRKEAGGWAAVNSLYSDPPASTEQVIDATKYGVDAPTNVSLPDTSTRAWDRLDPPGRRAPYETVGQAGLVAMFAYPTYDSSRPGENVIGTSFLNVVDGAVSESDPLNYDIAYANGWDGDKLWIYENATGANGYVWRLAWDSPEDAAEFAEGYRELLRYWGGERVRPGVWRIPEGESEFADAFAIQVSNDTVTIANAPTERQLRGVYGPLRE